MDNLDELYGSKLTVMTFNPYSSNKVYLLFIGGRPGSGKDTQADRLLVDYPKLTKISPGEIFRRAQNSNDPSFGRFYNLLMPYIEEMNNGGFVPPDVTFKIINQIIMDHLEEEKNMFIFSGMLPGIEYLNVINDLIAAIVNRDYEVKLIFFYLAVTKRTAINRISLRNGTPELPTNQKEKRTDDDPVIAEKRQDLFVKRAIPMMKELLKMLSRRPELGSLFIIRANHSIEIVHNKILMKVRSFLVS